MLGHTHPLAKKEFLTPKDLQNQTLISYRRNSSLWREINQRLIGIPDIKRIDVDNNEMLKTIVEGGLGIGITPALGIKKSNEMKLIIKDITCYQGYSEQSLCTISEKIQQSPLQLKK